jgi:hypothetical protein
MRKCPCVDVGLQCGLGCGLYPKCWDFLPAKDNVFMLRRGKTLALEFMNEGILRMKDIPGDVELKPYQHIQVQAHVRNKPYINKEDIREFLQKLQYPLYFLDFETINPGIPVYENSRPYQRIPFQFSLHVVEKVNAKPVHHSFLADGAGDPRAEVLNRLKKLLGTTGSIVAYYAGFEAGCLKEMARDLGKYIPWMKTIDKRFVDLMEPFDKFAYYDPKQCGSASIKAVLPALTGLSYDKMKIADGGTASNEFWRIVTEKNMPFAEIKQIRKSLEEYCGLDTKGMIEIVHVLKNNI